MNELPFVSGGLASLFLNVGEPIKPYNALRFSLSFMFKK